MGDDREIKGAGCCFVLIILAFIGLAYVLFTYHEFNLTALADDIHHSLFPPHGPAWQYTPPVPAPAPAVHHHKRR
jgi:hypothetical protein